MCTFCLCAEAKAFNKHQVVAVQNVVLVVSV